jgi:tetratricopeptide (TPR) repeat protein
MITYSRRMPISQPHPLSAFARIEQLRQQGRLDEAEQQCRILLDKEPDSVPLLNALAMLLLDRGETAQAQPLLQRAIAAAPDQPSLHNNLGNLLYRSDDMKGAAQAYAKAVALKPDYSEAHYNLGAALSLVEREDEALEAYSKALSVTPSLWSAKVQIAALLHKRGENEEALKTLDAAMPDSAASFEAWYYRGTTLHALARHNEAVIAFRKAAEIAPRRFEAQFALGGSLQASGHEDEALEAYRKTIEMAPGYVPAHREFNKLLHAMGRDVLQSQSYAFARSQVGDAPELLLAEADLMLRFNQTEHARVLLTRSRQAFGDSASVANAMGRALGLGSRLEEAQDEFHRAIELEPGVVSHRQELAAAQLRAGKYSAARDGLLRALAMAPQDQITLAYLTLAYRHSGDSRLAEIFRPQNFVREYALRVPAGFSDAAAFNAALSAELERLHTRRVEPIDQTLRGGSQTAAELFAQPSREIGLLRDSIREAIADYIKDLPADGRHPFLARKTEDFTFSGSWSCRLRSGGFHTNHIHDKGWISSAYYAALPNNVAVEGHGALTFGQSKFRLDDADRIETRVNPQVGKLVLFPSYYWHGTETFSAADPRLAVAFDVLPKSK